MKYVIGAYDEETAKEIYEYMERVGIKNPDKLLPLSVDYVYYTDEDGILKKILWETPEAHYIVMNGDLIEYYK